MCNHLPLNSLLPDFFVLNDENIHTFCVSLHVPHERAAREKCLSLRGFQLFIVNLSNLLNYSEIKNHP